MRRPENQVEEDASRQRQSLEAAREPPEGIAQGNPLLLLPLPEDGVVVLLAENQVNGAVLVREAASHVVR